MTIAAPFGGATKALTAIASGEAVRLILNKEELRDLERSFSSIPFLLPQESVFSDIPLMSIIQNGEPKNLTAKDLKTIFDLLDDKPGFEMWKRSKDLISHYQHPGVDVHCVVGKGIPTTEFLSYPDKASFPLNPLAILGDGDGTVNMISATVCLKWGGVIRPGNRPFSYQEFDQITHVDMAKNMVVVKHVVNEINIMNKENKHRIRNRSTKSFLQKIN